MIDFLQKSWDVSLPKNVIRREVIEWEANGFFYCLKSAGDVKFIISSPLPKPVEKAEFDPPQADPLEILNIDGLAKRLGVSRSTIGNMRKDGIIHAMKLGEGGKAAVRFNLQDVLNDIQKFNSKT